MSLETNNSSADTYKRAYLREKKARKQSEELLEVKSREIFKINRSIEDQCNTLLKRTTELELFHQLAVFVQKDVATDEALQYFIDLVCTSFDWPIGHVYGQNEKSESKIVSLGLWHLENVDKYQQFKELTESSCFEIGEGLPGKVFASDQAIWVDNVRSSDICLRKQVCDALINSAFAVPISIYGNVIAVAEFFTPTEQCIDTDLLKIIETAAIQLGTVLERRFSEKQTLENYTELQKTVEKLQETQTQLVQSEKLASVGQLAAGVAHEINNPIAFVSSNLRSLIEYIGSFKEIITLYEEVSNKVSSNDATLFENIHTRSDELDLDFLKDDIEQLLNDSLDGMSRVKDIVQGLKNFSRVDTVEMEDADINHCLTTTLKMLNNELKYKAQVTTDLQTLPKLYCNAGKLNQVFTNMIVNAGHAIDEQGSITISSLFDEECIIVKISDNGKGISAEHMDSLFTPFFTTKPVGEGTGLGLSISYGIIKEHNGDIDVASKLGEGTTFTIRLPYKNA